MNYPSAACVCITDIIKIKKESSFCPVLKMMTDNMWERGNVCVLCYALEGVSLEQYFARSQMCQKIKNSAD